MTLQTASLPEDLAGAHAMILAERAARLEAEVRASNAEAEVSGVRLEIERLRLLLARMRRERFGQSSERGARLVEQLELQLAELEEGAAEDEAAAEIAAPVMEPAARPRRARKPARGPLPENLPRERIVYPAPCACPKCGGPVRKLGEDVTESLECEPRRWKVVEHVREKVSCRSCEAVSQPPARACSPWCWPRSTGSTCRSPGRVPSTPVRASRSTSRPWPPSGASWRRLLRRSDHPPPGGLGGCRGRQPDADGRSNPRARLRSRAAAR